MKVFVGTETTAQINNFISGWRDQKNDLDVGWIDEEDLHTTVVKPWYSTDDGIERTKENMNSLASQLGTLVINFTFIASGPSAERSRLLFLGANPTGELTQFRDYVYTVLNQPPSPYPSYMPHVTIARYKTRDLNLKEEVSNIMEPIDSLTLYESPQGSAKGKGYNKLYTIYKQ